MCEGFVASEFEWVLKRLDRNIELFGSEFVSACTVEGCYDVLCKPDWVEGFYVGIFICAFEFSGDIKYLEHARVLGDLLIERLQNRIGVEHHDLGFLVVPSLVRLYEITLDERYLKSIVLAGELLLERFQVVGGFLQAWGDLDDVSEYRLIVDSLVNLELLYFCYDLTLDERFSYVSELHYEAVVSSVIREDFSCFHTFYFDPQSGAKVGGKTAQGRDDASSWARGQAWVLLGVMLHFKCSGSKKDWWLFERCYDYYKSAVGEDVVCLWDLSLDSGLCEYHDASACVIVCYSLLLAGKVSDVLVIMRELSFGFTCRRDDLKHGILDKCVYSFPDFKGVNESCLWGDYYYLKVLLLLREMEV